MGAEAESTARIYSDQQRQLRATEASCRCNLKHEHTAAPTKECSAPDQDESTQSRPPPLLAFPAHDRVWTCQLVQILVERIPRCSAKAAAGIWQRRRWSVKLHLTACQTSQPPPISAKPAQTKSTSERTTLAAVQWKVPSSGDPAGASLFISGRGMRRKRAHARFLLQICADQATKILQATANLTRANLTRGCHYCNRSLRCVDLPSKRASQQTLHNPLSRWNWPLRAMAKRSLLIRSSQSLLM